MDAIIMLGNKGYTNDVKKQVANLNAATYRKGILKYKYLFLFLWNNCYHIMQYNTTQYQKPGLSEEPWTIFMFEDINN